MPGLVTALSAAMSVKINKRPAAPDVLLPGPRSLAFTVSSFDSAAAAAAAGERALHVDATFKDSFAIVLLPPPEPHSLFSDHLMEFQRHLALAPVTALADEIALGGGSSPPAAASDAGTTRAQLQRRAATNTTLMLAGDAQGVVDCIQTVKRSLTPAIRAKVNEELARRAGEWLSDDVVVDMLRDAIGFDDDSPDPGYLIDAFGSMAAVALASDIDVAERTPLSEANAAAVASFFEVERQVS